MCALLHTQELCHKTEGGTEGTGVQREMKMATRKERRKAGEGSKVRKMRAEDRAL